MFTIKLSMEKRIKICLAAWFSDLPAINATVFTNLAVHVRLSVWSIFWSPFHQAITNLSTDLDSLGQGAPNKAFLK